MKRSAVLHRRRTACEKYFKSGTEVYNYLKKRVIASRVRGIL